jgi:hypothetical protein
LISQRRQPCGTANDVRQLAPEQIRQGRFSRVVFVDLPTPADRADIFRVHLARRGRDPRHFDLLALAQAAEGFSGAEIEAAVKGGLLDAFMDGARGSRPPTCCVVCGRSGPPRRSSARRSRSSGAGRASAWPSTPCTGSRPQPASG